MDGDSDVGVRLFLLLHLYYGTSVHREMGPAMPHGRGGGRITASRSSEAGIVAEEVDGGEAGTVVGGERIRARAIPVQGDSGAHTSGFRSMLPRLVRFRLTQPTSSHRSLLVRIPATRYIRGMQQRRMRRWPSPWSARRQRRSRPHLFQTRSPNSRSRWIPCGITSSVSWSII